MNGRLVLHECRRRGVTIYVEDGNLQLYGPLTDGLLDCIHSRKAELVELLSDPNLVHFGMHLVHESSPLSPGSGLGKWTRSEGETSENLGEEEERESKKIQSSPLSPVRPRTYTPRARNSPPLRIDPQTVKTDDDEGGENNIALEAMSYPRKSGLSGLSGLDAPPTPPAISPPDPASWAVLSQIRNGVDKSPGIIVDVPNPDAVRAAVAARQAEPPDIADGD